MTNISPRIGTVSRIDDPGAASSWESSPVGVICKCAGIRVILGLDALFGSTQRDFGHRSRTEALVYKGGRIIGMVVFGLGIIAMLFVFAIAYSMFTSPASELFQANDASISPFTAVGLGGAVVLVLVRIALLFIMTLAGSLIAGRGIQLYLSSGERDEMETPPEV